MWERSRIDGFWRMQLGYAVIRRSTRDLGYGTRRFGLIFLETGSSISWYIRDRRPGVWFMRVLGVAIGKSRNGRSGWAHTCACLREVRLSRGLLGPLACRHSIHRFDDDPRAHVIDCSKNFPSMFEYPPTVVHCTPPSHLFSVSHSCAGVNMSFARVLSSTSRALRTSSNPLQSALGARGQTQFVNSARSYATAFERSKPHVNIGTIGHVDHGKVCSHCDMRTSRHH